MAPPGYGAGDYMEIFDLSMPFGSEHLGTFFFGGGSKLPMSFQTTLYGNGILNTDVVNADTPDIGDVLCLTSDVPFVAGAAVTWSVVPGAASVYVMIVGTGGSSAGFGPLAGAGTTLLVNPGSVLTPPTPFVMTAGSVTTPPLPGLPPSVYAQCFGFTPSVGIGLAVEASNALRHSN